MNEQKILRIKKRTGEYVGFDLKKISNAIFKAAQAVGGSDYKISERLGEQVFDMLNEQEFKEDIPSVEDVQDCVEKVLIETGHAKTAKAFILYRQKRAEARVKAEALVGIKGLEEKQDPFGVNEELFGSSLTSHNIKITVTEPIAKMFTYNSKLSKLVDKTKINAYRKLFYMLKDMQKEGSLPLHQTNDYLASNELAMDIYKKKYYVRDLDDNLIEQRPEDVFVRLGAYLASIEEDEDNQVYFAQEFYKMLYEGYFVPGGRVIAGAGDLYRLKTLANCFVSVMDDDNIESIYKAAFECARTYSYGGGIGVDISTLRPREAVVHNAANFSTGSVSFMEIYSLTTGLIGQAGRRGALMLTIDVKHPDILNFIRVKQESNWVTKQIKEQCSWSGKFTPEQLDLVEKQVRENTQVRFANISMKVTDEFMSAVEEQNNYGKDKVIVYKKFSKLIINRVNQSKEMNFAFGIPSKSLENYELYKVFETIEEANAFIHKETNKQISRQMLENVQNRDIYGDVIVPVESQNYDLAVRYSGDYLLYFSSEPAGETRRLVKARDIWDEFVKGNYQTAEPGLIFWSRMTKYSPSNYIGRPIASTNPCGEVPLEDGGACNLGSINLSRLVIDGFTDNARINWNELERVTKLATRFLDNVVGWNISLNALDKQRSAAAETRRLGLGVMGIADMLFQLGLEYDSEEGIAVIEKVCQVIANAAYRESAELAEEKGASPVFDYNKYARNPFFKEALDDNTKELVKKKGLRNIAILSIAPTGTISNIVLGYKGEQKNYIGVSGGVEPVFAIFYTRRSENFGNKRFNIFHSTVSAYLDKKGLQEKAQHATTEDELRELLPTCFFRTAHYIEPEKRVLIQGDCQKYTDHSISSTVNLPESISPETISEIYIKAWKFGLKGITIYRDGSRYPILSIQQQQSAFQDFKKKQFKYVVDGKEIVVRGDQVIRLPNGKLSTPYHTKKENIQGIVLTEITEEQGIINEVSSHKPEDNMDNDKTKVCTISFEDGKLVKSCSE